MNTGKQWIIAVISLGLTAFPTAAHAAEPAVYTRTDFAMDTVVTETVYSTGEDITDSVIGILKDLETNLISWTNENSQIYRLNEKSGEEVQVSEELSGYLKQILKLSEDSNGAMDPTLGRVIRLWDIDGENPHVPADPELKSLMENVGYEKVSLSGNKVTLEEGCTLDLGAVGKGIGCDAVADYLEQQPEISGMILNLGGSSVMTYGEKTDGTAWKVAVTDPRDTEGDYLGVISLNGKEFLSTSGDYEKYFIEDGKRYHHILDSASGYPVDNGITSVTVVCDNGLDADGLSTACFALGVEKGRELLEKYEADGLFVDEAGEIYMTEGMEERFERR
ncbi:MAG: FAD:protein FMN transferase [Eubacteriales bacterium]|nr:FAD:protein FMN transferase [Eubacteriales bacterium]